MPEKIQTINEERDHFIRSIVEGIRELERGEFSERLNTLKLSWLRSPFAVAIVAPDYSSIAYNEKDALIQEYKSFVHGQLRKTGISVYCITDARNNVVCLLSLPEAYSTSASIDSTFVDIHKKFIEHFGLEAFIGVGNIVIDGDEISYSASEALEMLGYKFQYSVKGVVSAANIVPYQYSSALNNNIIFDRVIGCFQDGDIGKLAIRLDELIEIARIKPNASKTSIKRTLAEVLIHILHIASNESPDIEALLNGKDPYIWILEQNNTPAIRDWILNLCTNMIHLRQTEHKKTEKQLILKVREFVNDNLSSMSLGLESIAAQVRLTPTYFSQLFRNETGEGINAYITRLRLEQAKKLLATTDIKIDLIAAQLGFSSVNYFMQVFKKNLGTTPAKYRRESQN